MTYLLACLALCFCFSPTAGETAHHESRFRLPGYLHAASTIGKQRTGRQSNGSPTKAGFEKRAWTRRVGPKEDLRRPILVAEGNWSRPVSDSQGYALRGRLVLYEKNIAKEKREVIVYVELQDASDFTGNSIRVFCAMGKSDFRVENTEGLTCVLRDSNNRSPRSQAFAFSGGIPQSEWLTLPRDGTLRVRASPFGIWRPKAMAISPQANQLWVIRDGDSSEYFLSGKFCIERNAEQNATGDPHVWRGTIDLPPMKIVNTGQHFIHESVVTD